MSLELAAVLVIVALAAAFLASRVVAFLRGKIGACSACPNGECVGTPAEQGKPDLPLGPRPLGRLRER